MIKKLTLFVFIISTVVITPQQQKKYFDAPFGGGLGYMSAWNIPNLDPVNAELNSIGMPELSKGGFYSSGGAGFIYLGFIKFLRIGGMGYGGSVSTSKTVDGINREVVYNLGGGGITIEYTLPIIKDIALSVGAILGAGTMKIQLYRNSENFTWALTWEDFNSETNASFNRTLENSYWLFTPTINLDFPLNRFILVRLGTGYQLAFNDDWTADNEKEFINVPSDLNANAFIIHLGLFIGFFSF